MDYLEELENDQALDSEHGRMEHEHAVVLFPPNQQAGDTDQEDDPDELRPEQDGKTLSRGILLADGELQRGRPQIVGVTGMDDNEKDCSSGDSEEDGRGEIAEAEHQSPGRKRPCQGNRDSAGGRR